MQSQLRRGFGLACATVLIALLLIPDLPAGGTAGGTPPSEADLMQALDDYANGKMAAKADEAAKEQGLIAAGDTCMMRHVNLARTADHALRVAFASVQLESDATKARASLEALVTQASDAAPLVKWRLKLEAARLAIRAGDEASAKARLKGLLSIDAIPAVCASDTAFHLALVSSGPEAFALLERAAALDPAAMQVHEARLAHQLAMRPSQRQDCATYLTAQLEAIVQLSSLLRSDREIFRLEAIALAASQNAISEIMLGLLAEQRSDFAAAIQAYQRSLTHTRTPCLAEARYLVERRLADLEAKT